MNDSLKTLLIIAFLILIVWNLGAGLYYMLVDKGQSKRTVNALTRRIALSAQGFGRPRPTTPGARHVRDLVRKLGVVQIDSVNVVTRTHYLPAFSRLGDYPREVLEAEAWGKKRSMSALRSIWSRGPVLTGHWIWPAARRKICR